MRGRDLQAAGHFSSPSPLVQLWQLWSLGPKGGWCRQSQVSRPLTEEETGAGFLTSARWRTGRAGVLPRPLLWAAPLLSSASSVYSTYCYPVSRAWLPTHLLKDACPLRTAGRGSAHCGPLDVSSRPLPCPPTGLACPAPGLPVSKRHLVLPDSAPGQRWAWWPSERTGDPRTLGCFTWEDWIHPSRLSSVEFPPRQRFESK